MYLIAPCDGTGSEHEIAPSEMIELALEMQHRGHEVIGCASQPNAPSR